MKTKTKEKGVVKTQPTEVKEVIKPQFKSLNELFYFGKEKKYQCDNLTEYKRSLKSMNMGELQVHAVKVGLRPSRNRAMLEKTLINSFIKYNASLVPPMSYNGPIKNEKRVMDILAGRA